MAVSPNQSSTFTLATLTMRVYGLAEDAAQLPPEMRRPLADYMRLVSQELTKTTTEKSSVATPDG